MRIVGRIYGEGNVKEIEIENENISKISDVKNPTAEEELNVILPGLVDLHCHLREPGGEQAETIETGSKAAAAGGFTCVFAMANTNPVSDTASSVESTLMKAESVGLVQVQPIGAVTKNLEGKKLADIASMHSSSAKVQVFSDDGKCVNDSLLMRRALEFVASFKGVVAQHPQDSRLTENAQMNEGKVSAKIGLQGWSSVAEESIIARDCLLAIATGSKLHICHLTTKGSVELVRFFKQQLKNKQKDAKKDSTVHNARITAEVTPHHLLLTEALLDEYNPRYKVNPPLRTKEDVEALKLGVKDGTIDIIATDHAPHPLEAKYCNFQDSAFGMTGLETALQVVQKSLVDSKLISWKQVAQVFSEVPAKIGGVEKNQGRKIKVGEVANLVVYNQAKPEVLIDLEEQKTRSKNSPYKHIPLPGAVLQTLYKGKITFQTGN